MQIDDDSLKTRGRVLCVFLLAMSMGGASTALAQEVVDADTLTNVETRNFIDYDIAASESWFVRGFDSLLGITDSEGDQAAREEPVRIADEFRPYEGLRIRKIWILARESFGTVVLDTTGASTEDPADDVELKTSGVERALNSVVWSTRDETLHKDLLFAEGDPINPFELADSERLLRERRYISDAKIEVHALTSRPGWADVVVYVRDRWPIGVKARFITLEKYRLEVFHRNLLGRGLNLEYEIPVRSDKDPSVGYRVRTSLDNILGSFIGAALQQRDDWEYREWQVVLNRGFAYPGIRALGGWSYRSRTDRDHYRLPDGVDLKTTVADIWLGWNFPVRTADDFGKKRVRLIPAIRHIHTDYRDPPREFLDPEDQDRTWQDTHLYLAQATLLAVDYHATSLVYSYGETEDIPAGAWAAPTFGWEDSESRDRVYHAIGFAWATFTEGQSFLVASADYGGWRHGGRFEDGVLDLRLGGFSALTRQDYGFWRHFFLINYSLGINRSDAGQLRLDEIALRDLDSAGVAGDHRLAMDLESVLFTRYSLLGFKAAVFGYLAGGFVAPEDAPLLDQRFAANCGFGIRLNNPLLTIPTTEARIGLLSTGEGVEASFYIRMKDINPFRRELPTVVPSVYEYR